MSRRKNQESDSLDMLLDTLCNTFGIIILIALLVAILTFQSRPIEAEIEVDTISRELMERRIARVEDDLVEARKRQETLQTDLGSEELQEAHKLLEEKQRLEAKLTIARENMAETQGSLTTLAEYERHDPGELFAQLERQANNMKLVQIETDNALESAQEHLAQLQSQHEDLAIQLTEAEARRQRHFRLPRERRDAGMQHLYVFVRYGEIYPHYSFSRGFPSRNAHGIRWIQHGPRGEICEPIRGRGMGPRNDREAYLRFLATVPRSYYLSFLVWPDSFGAFGEAKQLAVDQGWNFSWEPVQPGAQIIFGPDGSPPPPPL